MKRSLDVLVPVLLGSLGALFYLLLFARGEPPACSLPMAGMVGATVSAWATVLVEPRRVLLWAAVWNLALWLIAVLAFPGKTAPDGAWVSALLGSLGTLGGHGFRRYHNSSSQRF